MMDDCCGLVTQYHDMKHAADVTSSYLAALVDQKLLPRATTPVGPTCLLSGY